MRKKTTLFAFIIATFAISCGGNKKSPTEFATPVKVAKVRSLENISYSFPAITKAEERVNLTFKVGGELTNLYIDEGESVKKGDKIAVINDTDYRLAMQSAKAAFEKSSLQRERYEKLVAKGAISQQEYESAKATFTRDKAAYNNARNNLSETTIYAPFSGIVEKRYVENYQRVQPSEPIATIINPSLLELSFTVTEKQLHLVNSPNKTLYVIFETYPNIAFSAVIDNIVDSSEGGGYPATASINDIAFSLEKYNIKPGFSATLYIDIYNEKYKNIVAVPITAVGEDEATTKRFVWVYNKGVVERRYVTIGAVYGVSDITITDGIKAGEEVVTAGIYSLKENQKVKLINN